MMSYFLGLMLKTKLEIKEWINFHNLVYNVSTYIGHYKQPEGKNVLYQNQHFYDAFVVIEDPDKTREILQNVGLLK